MPDPSSAPRQRRIKRLDGILSALLAALTLALYSPVRGFPFISLDDSVYVTNNPFVRSGFSLITLRAAFVSGQEGFWFPLTRLAHTLDFALFGANAGGHHILSVVIHALATLGLYFFLLRATGDRVPSAFTAAIFAWHPLHIESVAWVAERKDVLSALFSFLTLWLWVRYTERPSTRRYALVLGAFALGLMSKPMVVTLPILLLILDFWPLRRPLTWQRLTEKVPFGILAALAAAGVYFTQASVGAVKSASSFPLLLRFQNGIVTWVLYIRAAFWPDNLAIVYPYPDSIPASDVAFSGLLLVVITAAAVLLRSRYPWLLAGWLWYLFTTLPVIGFIQVGMAARTDHFMYIPLIGLALPVCWTFHDLATRYPRLTLPVSALALVASAGMLLVSARQLAYWQSSESLYRQATRVTGPNYLADIYMARLLGANQSRRGEAVELARRAVHQRPGVDGVNSALATLLADAHRYEEALVEARAALRIAPNPEVYTAMGAALQGLGKPQEAIPWLRKAIEADPAFQSARAILANVLIRVGDREAARTLLLDPLFGNSGDSDAESLTGSLLIQVGEGVEGLRRLDHAVELNPQNPAAHNNLGSALVGVEGRQPEALFHLREAVRLDPSFAKAWLNLGGALVRMPDRAAEAVPAFENALRLNPDPALQQQLDALKARLGLN